MMGPERRREPNERVQTRSVMPPVEDRNDRERSKAIEMAVGQIEKQFGKGSIMRLGQKDAGYTMPSISTGSVSLDYALGIGGVPRGRVVEIFGPESSGKTTLSLQVIAEAQKLGGMAAFVDAEHALDAQYEKKLTGVVSKSKTCLIFINQLREKIGVMFGNPETTTGGRALKFYASVRIDIRRIASIKDGDQVIGGRTRVKVVKNKVAPPFREAEFDVMYGEGISREGDLLDLAVEKKIVEKSGTWFSYNGERLGQGRENVKAFLKENPSIFKSIEERVRRELGLIKEA